MLFNVKTRAHMLIGDYRRSTDHEGAIAREFIIKHRREIVQQHSFSTFKEMTLNYRVLFDGRNKTKIVHDYKKYVMLKEVPHKSDLAIGYNIVKFIKVDADTESMIVEFMFDRIKHEIPAAAASVYFLKKRLVLDYIAKNIVTKSPK